MSNPHIGDFWRQPPNQSCILLWFCCTCFSQFSSVLTLFWLFQVFPFINWSLFLNIPRRELVHFGGTVEWWEQRAVMRHCDNSFISSQAGRGHPLGLIQPGRPSWVQRLLENKVPCLTASLIFVRIGQFLEHPWQEWKLYSPPSLTPFIYW